MAPCSRATILGQASSRSNKMRKRVPIFGMWHYFILFLIGNKTCMREKAPIKEGKYKSIIPTASLNQQNKKDQQ